MIGCNHKSDHFFFIDFTENPPRPDRIPPCIRIIIFMFLNMCLKVRIKKGVEIGATWISGWQKSIKCAIITDNSGCKHK